VKKDLLAAHRYSRALFELAKAEGRDEAVEAALESFSAGLKADPAGERFLGNPALGKAKKKEVVERLFGSLDADTRGLLVRFTLLLFQKNRFYLVHDIAQNFRTIADESQGQGIAEIRSASALSEAQRAAIVSRIERIAGKKMVVRAEVDPSLLGGVVVKVGNRVIDDSAAAKIQNFKKELTKTQSI
jgi:F-type H+-transporting ATPase subunit delta